MIFGIAAVLILLMIFSGVAVPLAFLGGSFFVAYMGDVYKRQVQAAARRMAK